MTVLAFTDQSPLHSGGPVDDHILTVYTPLFWVSVVIGVGVSAAIIYSALRFRRKSDDEEPVQVHGNSRLELGWTLVPLAILLGLFVLTASQMHFISTAPAGAMPVHVWGQQFSWSFYYEGHNNGSGKPLFSTGTLYVPEGQPVALTIDSRDVNHSLYIPTLAGQMNAIPGQTNRLWFQADHQGTYYGQCTELCGVLHWQMSVKVVALPLQQFQSCISSAEQKSGAPIVHCGGST